MNYSRIVIFGLLIFSKCAILNAVEEKISLKADFLRFDQTSSLLIASGNVEVFSPSFSIKSNELSVDSSQNIFTFENKVNGLLEGNSFSADKFTLFGDDDASEAHNISAKVRTKEVGGVVSFRAASLFKKGEEQWGESGDFTTCKFASSHFHIISSAYHYYPGDKAEISNMVFSIGPVPIMYSPYWIYKLGHMNPIFYYPVIGQDETSGWFLQTTWDYFWDYSNNSLFLVDWYEKIGFGLGVDHSWKIDSDSDLRAKVFGLMDTKGVLGGQNKYYTDLKYNLKIGKDISTNWAYYYQTYDRYSNNYLKKEQKTFSSNIKYAGAKDRVDFGFQHFYDYLYGATYRNNYNLNVNGNYTYKEDNYKAPAIEQIDRKYGFYNNMLGGNQRTDYSMQERNKRVNSSTLSWHYDRTLSLGSFFLPTLQYALDPVLTQRRTDPNAPYDQTLNHRYTANFSPDGRTPLTSLSVRYEWKDDLDGTQVTTDLSDKYQVKVMPEVRMSFKTLPVNILNPFDVSGNALNLFTMQQNNFLFGHYIETRKLANSDYYMNAKKYSLSTVLTREQRIDEINTLINYNSRLEQLFYDTGDQANTRDDNYGLSLDWFGFFRYALSYSQNFPGFDMYKKDQTSNSPFYFDAKSYQRYFNRSQTLSMYLLSPQEELPARYTDLAPSHPRWQMMLWNFSWSHNFINNYSTDVNTDMTLRPIETLLVNLSAVFDPYDKYTPRRFWTQPLTGTVRWDITKDFYLNQIFRIDLNLPQSSNLLNASTELGYVQQIGDEEFIKFRWNSLWDNFQKRWWTNNYSVAWEQDCIVYMYDYSRAYEEHKFTFKVRAFESDPLGYTKSRVNGMDKWQFQGLNKSMEKR